ncbi:MAG: hypothetical protein DRQ42_00600 [Gammaproteobacteria bacterium]|nr:MAG: hypothetical protein DRQ42_00600 [Gammaproteobacteria bacterium]
MNVWSLIKDGKDVGNILLQFDNLTEIRHFTSFLKDFLKQNPHRLKVKSWIKEIQKNLPID